MGTRLSLAQRVWNEKMPSVDPSRQRRRSVSEFESALSFNYRVIGSVQRDV